MSTQKTIQLVVVNYAVSRDAVGNSFGWYDTVVKKKNDDYYQLVDVGIDMMNTTNGINAYIFDDDHLPTGSSDLGAPLATDDFDLNDPVPGLVGVFAKIAEHFVAEGVQVNNYAIKYNGHGGYDGIFGWNTEEGSSGLILKSDLKEPKQGTTYQFLHQVCHGNSETGNFGGVGKLAFLDFSLPCSTSGIANYLAAQEFADYFIASDLERGSDGGTGTEPTYDYDTFWTSLENTRDLGPQLDLLACVTNFMKAWETYFNPVDKSAGALPNRLVVATPGSLDPSTGETFSALIEQYEKNHCAGVEKGYPKWWAAWGKAAGWTGNSFNVLQFLEAANREAGNDKYSDLIENIKFMIIHKLTATNQKDVDWKKFEQDGWKNLVGSLGVCCEVTA